jgi:sulfide:quinone oxidoreductase
VVTLPRLSGRIVEGIPHDNDGFVRTDEFGRVAGLKAVYAVGDMTTFPIKQGGIPAHAGADVAPRPFKPVLRGLLLTGDRPAFLRADLVAASSEPFTFDHDPLWWPAGKIAARYLAPYLAEHSRSDVEHEG